MRARSTRRVAFAALSCLISSCLPDESASDVYLAVGFAAKQSESPAVYPGRRIFIQARGGTHLGIVSYGGAHTFPPDADGAKVSCVPISSPNDLLYLYELPDAEASELYVTLFKVPDEAADAAPDANGLFAAPLVATTDASDGTDAGETEGPPDAGGPANPSFVPPCGDRAHGLRSRVLRVSHTTPPPDAPPLEEPDEPDSGSDMDAGTTDDGGATDAGEGDGGEVMDGGGNTNGGEDSGSDPGAHEDAGADAGVDGGAIVDGGAESEGGTP